LLFQLLCADLGGYEVYANHQAGFSNCHYTLLATRILLVGSDDVVYWLLLHHAFPNIVLLVDEIMLLMLYCSLKIAPFDTLLVDIRHYGHL